MSKTILFKHFVFSCFLVLLLCSLLDNMTMAQETETPVRVGHLVYADGMSGKCFAEAFLTTVARETGIEVQRTFEMVDLASERIYEFPFLVMTGSDRFTLSDAEKDNLRTYLNRGGFLLASAGCSNGNWADSYRTLMAELFSDSPMQPLALDHPIFHMIYDIERIDAKKGDGQGTLWPIDRRPVSRCLFTVGPQRHRPCRRVLLLLRR